MLEILKDISIMWSLIHTLVLFLFLFESRFPKKKTITLTVATMVPLILINFLLFIVVGFEKYNMLMLLTLSLPSCVVFWLMAKHRDGRFFFTFCMVDTIVLEIIYITNILNHYLTPDSYLVLFVVRTLAYPLIELWAFKKLRPMFLDVQKHVKRGWGIFAVIGVSFYLAITLLMSYPTRITDRPEYIPVLAILFVLMPVIYIHIITTLRNQQLFHEMSEQENIMRLQVSNITSRIEELGAANEAFREERHDFRHKMQMIANLVATKQYDELEQIASDYAESLEKTKVRRYCRNAVIDAVLSVYIPKAENLGITVKWGFSFPDTFTVKDYELATALANAVENAINACIKLPPEQRLIEIKSLSRPQFIIMVRNTFDGEVEFDKNYLPLSGEEGHGFGTRSIAAFCTKNGGYYEFQAENGVFTLFMHLK